MGAFYFAGFKVKQFKVIWYFTDNGRPVRQTMHMSDDKSAALKKSRNQMYAMRYNVGQMVAEVVELGEAPAKPAAKKPVSISTEVDNQYDFWWNKI